MKTYADSVATPALARGEAVGFVIERLRQGIIEGRFAPGQRLLTSELMDEIGVSRGTLREAFNQMASDGLLELIPNRGAVVCRLSRPELLDLFRVREVLEGLAARLAAEVVEQPGHREHLQQLLREAELEPYPPAPALFSKQNSLFHGALVNIGGNSQLASLIDKLQLPMRMPQLSHGLTPVDIELSIQEHVVVMKAVLAADPDAADLAMRQHLRNSCQRLLRLSEPFLKPVRRPPA